MPESATAPPHTGVSRSASYMRRTFPPASAAVATMAALSTACRVAAFVPSFASNTALLGSGRARHFVAQSSVLFGSSISRRFLVRASGKSSKVLAGTREQGRVRSARVGALQMSSSPATQDAVEALTASIKAKGDEIRRYDRFKRHCCCTAVGHTATKTTANKGICLSLQQCKYVRNNHINRCCGTWYRVPGCRCVSLGAHNTTTRSTMLRACRDFLGV